MNVLITLTSAGTDTGPFNLYSNVDNYTTAFETDISKGILVAGYTSTIVPPGTSAIRVKSMGICTNYVDITLTVPSTTTTTTTAAPIITTTTTSTTAAPIITTTTTSTTAAPSPVITTTTTSTTALAIPTTTTTSTTTAYVGAPTTTTTSTTSTSTSTTSTTTTAIVTEWYQITRCDTLAVEYSAGYTSGSFFALNDRVTDFGLNVYTVTAIYSVDPGGSGLFLGYTGLTGCPGVSTTTTTSTIYFEGTTTTTTSTTSTTTTAAPAPAEILVDVNDSSGSPLSCLGTDYPVTIQTATATVYDQFGNITNAVGDITVTLNTTYNPCYGGSSTQPVTITIFDGYSSNSTSWDASRTVDCGQSNCLLETQFYDCAFSNTASLPFKAGTVTCTSITTTTTTTAAPTPPTTTTTTTAEPVAPTTTTTTTAEPVAPTTTTTTSTTTAEPVAPTTTTTTSTTEAPATTTTTTTEAPSVNAQWYAVPSGSGGCGTAVLSVTKNSSSVVSVSFSSGQSGTFSVVAGDVLVITTLAGASGSVCSDPYVEYSGNQFASDGQTGLGPVQAQITVTVSAGDILNGSIILGGTLDGSVIPS